MVQAQGLRPFDPYRALQLHPHAPRKLVVEAFWSLVNRSRRSDAMTAEGARRTEEMSAAYALLMDDARRRAYDNARGVLPPERRPTAPDDHYAALCVDHEADAEIIELAHGLMALDEQHRKKSVQQFLLDEAYRTLSNPQLRAQYDASQAQRRDRERVVTLVDLSGLVVKPARPREHRPRKSLFGRGRPDATATQNAEDARLLTLSERALDWDVAQTATTGDADALADAEAEVVFIAGRHAGRRVAVSERTVRIGDSPDDDVVLGLEPPDTSIAIWQHGERFMLRQESAQSSVTISGRPPGLPIVVLDDGDEVAVGPHHMRFRRIPES